MAEESVMDAVNAALAGTVPEPEQTDEVIVDENADGSGDAGEVSGDELGDIAAKPEGEEGETPEGEESAEGVEAEAPDLAAEAELLGVSKRNADGTFKSKEKFAADVAAAKATETARAGTKAPAGKPDAAAAAAAKAGKKAADPINDPIPADLKQETQQRIRTLIDRTKASEEKATQVQQNFDYLVQGVQSTGASPEQYGETLSWLSLFNSGDPKQQEKALEIIEDVADRLATMVGKERKVADPLAAHLDLQQAVAKGQLTAQYAKEVARSRNQGAFRQELQSHASVQQQQEQAAATEKETARTDLNSLEESLKATDPLYEQKKAAILPTLKVVFPTIRPSQWKETFTKLYREARVVPRIAIRRPVVTGQPMRANKSGAATGGGNPQKQEPKTPMDVMNAALASVGK